jgi:hypothetical protein
MFASSREMLAATIPLAVIRQIPFSRCAELLRVASCSRWKVLPRSGSERRKEVYKVRYLANMDPGPIRSSVRGVFAGGK